MNRMKIDEIAYSLTCSVNALSAIQTAMAEGPFKADTFLDGLYFVTSKLEDLAEQLRREVDKKD